MWLSTKGNATFVNESRQTLSDDATSVDFYRSQSSGSAAHHHDAVIANEPTPSEAAPGHSKILPKLICSDTTLRL